MSRAPRGYRARFVETCLAGAPGEARSFIAHLEDVTASVIARNAPDVDRRAAYPSKSLAVLGELGAFGVAAPPSAGGRGFGDAVAVLTVEVVAAACPSTAAILMFHNQVVRRVERFGTDAQRRDDLPRLVSGEWIGASAWSELGAGADKARLATRVHGEGDQRTATGEKAYCTGLEGAGLFHVLLGFPRPDGTLGPTFVRVRPDTAGVNTEEVYDLLGLRGSSTGTIRLDDVPVRDADIVGGVGAGMQLMRANHETPMNPGLLALGIARAAYEEIKRGATGRWEGMNETTSYQNTRFALAEMEVKLGAAYSYAAQVVDYTRQGVPEIDVECLKLKMHASTTAAEVTSAAVQLAGARGFTATWPLARHFRDARATSLMGPTNEIIKERIASQIVAEKEERAR